MYPAILEAKREEVTYKKKGAFIERINFTRYIPVSLYADYLKIIHYYFIYYRVLHLAPIFIELNCLAGKMTARIIFW